MPGSTGLWCPLCGAPLTTATEREVQEHLCRCAVCQVQYSTDKLKAAVAADLGEESRRG